MYFIFVARVVSKLDKSSDSSESQPLNILEKSVIRDVSNDETSSDFRDEQPWNIRLSAEPTACEVLKFERSRLSRAEQPLNMDSKQATFFVSKDERFTDFKRSQFQNI